MTKNEGTVDRVIRLVAGALLLFLLPDPWRYVGIIPILTGAVGVCPLYSVFGINTCKR